ncbi:rhodanese-like domain-containing protein [Mucilaginibacter lacusdianchii]|uniref:rhodanese-like domain-containing protein n=1 Tax=Mucilaginibacter lacusdianchii TaxID=2684211 RepID=UPI00131A9986|nr:rhodanese-like domain-containing protein [Mucilaginibacter sp. JXJ CY 39]
MNSHSPNSSPDINAGELLKRLQSQEELAILDVREPIEFHTHNIGGVNLPVSQLAAKLDSLPWPQNKEIIVICQAGLRSETAQSILQQNGYENVRNLNGGLLALRRIRD